VNVLCIHFNNEILDPNDVKAEGAKGSEQAVELELGLRVASLAFIPGNGTEAGGVATTISTVLSDDPPHTAPRRVYGEINGEIRRVINRNKSWGCSYGIFESLHRALVLVLPSEEGALASEIDKGTCDRRIVANPNTHEAGKA